MWCFPKQGSYKMGLRKIYKNYDKVVKEAEKLQKFLLNNFTEEQKYKEFVEHVYKEEKFEIDEWLDELKDEVYD